MISWLRTWLFSDHWLPVENLSNTPTKHEISFIVLTNQRLLLRTQGPYKKKTRLLNKAINFWHVIFLTTNAYCDLHEVVIKKDQEYSYFLYIATWFFPATLQNRALINHDEWQHYANAKLTKWAADYLINCSLFIQ